MSTFLSLAFFHARQLFRIPFFVQVAVLAPLSFLLMRALGALNSQSELSPAAWLDASVAGVWATTTTAVGLIGYQRFQGTLEAQVLSVHRPGIVFGSLTASAALIGVLGLPLTVLLQVVLGSAPSFDGRMLVGFVGALVACMASAALLSSLFVANPSAASIEPLIMVPIWMLVGIVVPFSSLPTWLSPIALIHPLTSAVLAAHADSFAHCLAWMAVSVVVSAGWLIVAGWGLRAAIKRARIDGTLAVS